MALFRIFGAGEWGLAVANHLSILNNPVEIFLRDITKVELYEDNRTHRGLNIEFGKNISFFGIDKINTLKNDKEIINIIATSSSGFLPIIETNINYFNSYSSLSWITKGLDHSSGLLFHQLLDKLLSNNIDKCVISGPSFAKDLVDKKQIEVSIATKNYNLQKIFMDAMSSKCFKLLPTNDIIGIEISGVLKNIAAILAGSLTANQFPDEYIDELISISQEEVYAMSKLIRGKNSLYPISDDEMKKTLNSPACIGDLRLTCFYNASRNRQLGLKLTKGCNVDKLISKIGTVEGYLSTATLFNNKKVYGEGRLVKAANDILYNNIEPKTVLNSLFN